MYNEFRIDNALVAMKDRLWQDSISDDINKIRRVLDVLESVIELWATLRYSYKGAEIARNCRLSCERIYNTIPPQAKKRRLDNTHEWRRSVELFNEFHGKRWSQSRFNLETANVLPNGAEIIQRDVFSMLVLAKFKNEYVIWRIDPDTGNAYWGKYYTKYNEALPVYHACLS